MNYSQAKSKLNFIIGSRNSKYLLGFLSLFLAGFLFFTGCDSGYTVKSEKTPNFDFKKFKTYAWLPNMDSITVRGVDQSQLNGAIGTNIEEQLLKRGLTVDTLHPQMLIRYSVMLNNSITIVNTPIYDYRPAVSMGFGGGYYGGYSHVGVYTQAVQVGTNVQQVPYRNGQLIIDIIDHETNKVVWRGYAYGSKKEDYQNADIMQMRERVHTIVDDIFWYCPIKKK